jgi:hypothetical protein
VEPAAEGDSSERHAVRQFTIANLDANHFLQATFSVDTYVVTPQLLGGLGKTSPLLPQTVSYGTLPPVTGNVTLAMRFVRLGS